jgi:tRNA-2-methylthio-N6-dimethylallyladenosine synthase
MEGCSQVLQLLRGALHPRRRGQPPFDDVLTEVAGLADQGVKEVTLLGQNVNAYRGAMGDTAEIADFALLLEYVARSRASSASATPPATRTSSRSA